MCTLAGGVGQSEDGKSEGEEGDEEEKGVGDGARGGGGGRCRCRGRRGGGHGRHKEKERKQSLPLLIYFAYPPEEMDLLYREVRESYLDTKLAQITPAAAGYPYSAFIPVTDLAGYVKTYQRTRRSPTNCICNPLNFRTRIIPTLTTKK